MDMHMVRLLGHVKSKRYPLRVVSCHVWNQNDIGVRCIYIVQLASKQALMQCCISISIALASHFIWLSECNVIKCDVVRIQ